MFSKFEFCEYLNLWVFKICGYSNLWVHTICDDTKFQVSGREYQNICVLCISYEQKNICAFSIYAFCHMCKTYHVNYALGITFGAIASCTTTELSKSLTSCLTAVKSRVIIYYETVYERSRENMFWSIKKSGEVSKQSDNHFDKDKLKLIFCIGSGT